LFAAIPPTKPAICNTTSGLCNPKYPFTSFSFVKSTSSDVGVSKFVNPFLCSSSTKFLPTKPLAPVTKIVLFLNCST